MLVRFTLLNRLITACLPRQLNPFSDSRVSNSACIPSEKGICWRKLSTTDGFLEFLLTKSIPSGFVRPLPLEGRRCCLIPACHCPGGGCDPPESIQPLCQGRGEAGADGVNAAAITQSLQRCRQRRTAAETGFTCGSHSSVLAWSCIPCTPHLLAPLHGVCKLQVLQRGKRVWKLAGKTLPRSTLGERH